MDLHAAHTQATFNLFTALIQLDGGGLKRQFYGIPFISDPPFLPEDPTRRLAGRWATSTLHHELTHLASVRVTRLGWALGLEGAETPASIPPRPRRHCRATRFVRRLCAADRGLRANP